MRIIPKRTKVKVQFYKGIGIYDVIIGVIALAFLALAVTSNLPNFSRSNVYTTWGH